MIKFSEQFNSQKGKMIHKLTHPLYNWISNKVRILNWASSILRNNDLKNLALEPTTELNGILRHVGL